MVDAGEVVLGVDVDDAGGVVVVTPKTEVDIKRLFPITTGHLIKTATSCKLLRLSALLDKLPILGAYDKLITR